MNIVTWAAVTRLLVTHHPLFAMPIGEGGGLTRVVERHEEAIEAVCEAGVHILLAGHFHRSFSGSAREMVRKAGPALVIQAGTATSVRLRAGEAQSFNLIHALSQRRDRPAGDPVEWPGLRRRQQGPFHLRRRALAFAGDGGGMNFPSRSREGIEGWGSMVCPET